MTTSTWQTGSSSIELSVVVPVFGCAGCLPDLHARLTPAARSVSERYELIFVDDRSPDHSWEILESLAARDEHIVALRLSRNFGQDAAIMAGVSRSSGRWTVMIDCDLEEPPEAIPALYAKAQEGFDLVRGVRRTRRTNWFMTAVSRLWLRLMLEGDERPDYGTLCILSRPVVESFLRLQDRDREFRLILDWLGYHPATVAYDPQPRWSGRSTYTFRRLLRVALDGMFFRTTALLRGIVFLGLVIAVTGMGLAVYDVYEYLDVGAPRGFTSLEVLLLLLGGFIIISVGVVGLYVGRIFEQVKGRPLFIIDREIQAGTAKPPSAVPPVRVATTRIEEQ